MMPINRLQACIRCGLGAAIALTATAAAATHYTSQVVQQFGDAFFLEGMSHEGVLFGSFAATSTTGSEIEESYVDDGRHQLPFRPLGAKASRALGMNRSGDVTGDIARNTGEQPFESYVRSAASGVTTAIRVPGAAHTDIWGINAAGTVVGESLNLAGIATGFRWSNGTYTTYPSTFGGRSSEVNDINDAGVMVGWAAVAPYQTFAALWTPDGQVTRLDTLPGGVGSTAQKITAAGLVVGTCEMADGKHRACTWQGGAGPVDLGMPPDKQDADAYTLDVNASGTVVGEIDFADARSCAALWANGEAINLQNVSTLAPGVKLKRALSIADDGRILAFAIDQQGNAFTLMLTPDQ